MGKSLSEYIFEYLEKNKVNKKYLAVTREIEADTLWKRIPADFPFFYLRTSGHEILGVDTVEKLESWSNERFTDIAKQWNKLREEIELMRRYPCPDIVGPKILGGFSFSSNDIDESWDGFAPALFHLPRVIYEKLGIKVYETIIIDLKKDIKEQISTEYEYLQPDGETKVKDVIYPITKEDWHLLIEQAHHLIEKGTLEKVVLARSKILKLNTSPNIINILEKLIYKYPSCNIFAFKPADTGVFVGASPELLISLTGPNICSMALAGTIQRGETFEEDERKRNALLQDTKERGEHDFVVDMIDQTFEKLGLEPKKDDTHVVTYGNVHHLCTNFTAVAKSPVNIFELLQNFHPTAALGGVPRNEALKFITENEGICRGYYASPLGWVDAFMDGRFIVGIRSGLFHQNYVLIYGGAGVVYKSDAEREWEEIELKFKPMLEVVGLAHEIKQ